MGVRQLNNMQKVKSFDIWIHVFYYFLHQNAPNYFLRLFHDEIRNYRFIVCAAGKFVVKYAS